MTTFDDEIDAARRSGNLTAYLSAQRRAQEADLAAAEAAYAATPEGEQARLRSEMNVAGALMSPAQWASVHAGRTVPPQPSPDDLTPAERARVIDERFRGALDRSRKEGRYL